MENEKDEILRRLLDEARNHVMTPQEKRAQRVSLIMGLRDEGSTLTRQKVTEVLAATEGLQAN